MKKRYKRTFLVLYAFCSLLAEGVSAQSLVLSLEKTISLAADSSLEAFRTKNLFLSGYWEFRNYKAERLPSLTLNITPAEYYRDITKRYDSEKDIDEYRKQQSFYAGGNLKIKQNFDMLGGSFFVDTDLGYMRYFGSNTYNQFTSVPIRIGYSQDLLGYNPFRWEKKIEPLKYEKVKKELLYNIETVSEQVAFNAMFTDLTAAIDILTVRAEQGATIVADYDAVYAGDTRKWVKYANSLMLRLAMRISYADETTAQKYARQALNHTFGVMTSKSDEAQMSTGAGMVFRNNIEWLANQYNECRMGSSMFSYLLGYQDPRLSAYFEASPSAYAVAAFDGKNYQAVPPGNANQQNTIYTDFSKPNITSNTPTYWMRASEVYFLRAEAALRWGSEFGDAEALYEQGVAMSFDENGISSSVDDYLASGLTPIAHNMRASYYSYNAAAPTTATPAFSGGTEEKLEKIMIQKWIALYPNGHEAWTEWRRTGYPKLNQVQTNRGQGVTREGGIRRMVYPVSFYQSAEDRANYEEALKLLGGLDKDKATTQLWWDCKNQIY